jgi:hypothetical protein
MKKLKPQPRRKNGKPRRPAGGFKLFQHPLSDVDPALVRAAFLDMATKKVEVFPTLIGTVLQLLRDKSPLHIIAVLAGYGLQAGVSKEGVGAKRLIPKIEQHHVELLQALTLTLPVEEWGESPASSSDIQKVIDTVIELADAFHHRRLKAIENEADLQARALLALQERLRLHTQIVRNWGYFSEVVQVSSELYAPLDEQFLQILGFGASDLIATARQMVSMIGDRSNERFSWLKRTFHEKSTGALVRAYYENHPNVEGDPEEFLKGVPNGVTREQVAYRLLAHADLQFVEVMNFTVEAVVARSGISKDVTKRVLDALSLPVGHLRNEDPEHLFMGNPVWQAPLIEMVGGYFCPAPQSIFSHIHSIMRALADKAGVKAALESQRAAYLEAKVEKLLLTALPDAEVRHNVKWNLDTIDYETDHITKIDKTVIIVEDKSAALTAPGLRGAPDRLRRHIEDLIVAPSKQSMRLEATIWQAKGGDSKAIESVAPFGINFSDTEQIIRISVTLDDFSVLASAEMELKEAELVSHEMSLATTLNVADLQAAIDILGRPSFFLHYFAERARFQKVLHIFADEMDFLGCYLETGLNMGELETQQISLSLSGMSGQIDHYYNSRDAGIATPKPKPKLSPYFSTLIDTIESRAFARWSVITIDLLRCASYEEQRQIDRLLLALKKKVEKNWRDPKHECSLIVSPPQVRETAVVFYAYPSEHAPRRREIAQELAANALEASGRNRCIMICRETARWAEPYASVVVFNSESTPTDNPLVNVP